MLLSGSESQASSETVSPRAAIVLSSTYVTLAATNGIPQCADCIIAIDDFGVLGWGALYDLDDGDCDQFSDYCYPCTGYGSGDEDCRDDPDVIETGFSDSLAAMAWAQSEEGCGTCEMNQEVPALIEEEAEYELAAIIEASQGRVWLNSERSAMQGLGCGNAVGMHLPINADLYRAISEALNDLQVDKSRERWNRITTR